jgi:hypothetical protein
MTKYKCTIFLAFFSTITFFCCGLHNFVSSFLTSYQYVPPFHILNTQYNGSLSFWRSMPMRNISIDFDFYNPDPDHDTQYFKTLKHNPELLYIKQKLLKFNLWEDLSVQYKFKLACLGTTVKTRDKYKIELLQLIENYKIRAMESDDPFMPDPTKEQISRGGNGVHIFDQYNNHIPFYIDPYSYCLLWLILGPQGGGKSSAAFYQVRQINVPVQILDPKGTWIFRAEQLHSQVILPEYLCLDLDFDKEQLQNYLHSVMEGIAYATGLQYGLSCLFEACDIALEQRHRYIEQTGDQTPLCIKDIHSALALCETKNSKRTQYIESARTALDLLLGRNKLFETRSGLSLTKFFAGNYILPCQYLTVTQSRFVGWFLLNNLLFRSLNMSETTELKSLLVLDDASKFISRPDNIFSSGTKTSIFIHPLSTLRSTGRGIIFLDQLAEPITDDVKQLCNNWMICGGMRGIHNQSEVASAMGLTPDQAAMLGRLKSREAICFCPTTFPYAVHGTIPIVPAPLKETNQ